MPMTLFHLSECSWLQWLLIDFGGKVCAQSRNAVDGSVMQFLGVVLVVLAQGFGTTADDFRQSPDVGAVFQGQGDESLPQVIGPDPAGDAGAVQGRFPGALDRGDFFAPIKHNLHLLDILPVF